MAIFYLIFGFAIKWCTMCKLCNKCNGHGYLMYHRNKPNRICKNCDGFGYNIKDVRNKQIQLEGI